MKIKSGKKIFAIFLFIFICFSYSFYTYQKKAVIILTYHSVMKTVSEINGEFSINEKDFEKQMLFLKNAGYNVISLTDALEGIKGNKELPDNPTVLTFDDGYRDNFYIAWPILKKYDFTATVFLAVKYVDTDGFLSWDDINAVKAKGLDFQSHTYSHVALGSLGKEEVLKELTLSKKVAKEKADINMTVLAYPFGSYNSEVFNALKTADYEGACIGKLGTNDKKTQLYELKRVNVSQSEYGMLKFRARLYVAKIFGWLRYIKKF